MWAIKPSKKRKFTKILAAVDPDTSETDKSKILLNQQIIELAISLAIRENCELHIVRAWSVWGEHLFARRTQMSQEEFRKQSEENRKDFKTSLDHLLEKFVLTDIEHRIHLLKGDPGVLIPKLVQKLKIDTVVMGTVCRTGLPGFIVGNTAENILQNINCGVLALKPKGFKTPVKL